MTRPRFLEAGEVVMGPRKCSEGRNHSARIPYFPSDVRRNVSPHPPCIELPDP